MLKNNEGLTKVFTGVGVLAVSILIVWGAINIAKFIPSALSGLASAAVTLTSVFIPSNEGIQLSTTNNVVDIEKPFTLTWKNGSRDTGGTYNLSYSCIGDLVFEVGSTDGLYVTKECDTPFEVFGNELRIIPVSSSSRFLDVQVTITYTKIDGTSISDETIITVVNEDVTNSRDVVTTPNTSTVTPGERTEILVPISGTNSYSNPNGSVDLAARVISTGIVDIDTNEYTQTDTITSNDRVGIQFEVENLGTKASGVWSFTVVLPTQTIYFYNSTEQRSLNPGDRIEFTIGFDGVKTSDDVEVVINVDPSGQIGEVSEENNIVRHKIDILVVSN